MKKISIYLLVFALLLKISIANILISYPSAHTVTKDITYSFNITINNNNSFDIKNLQFSPITYFKFPNKFNMTSNSITSAEVNITATSAFSSQSFTSTFSFNIVQNTTREPATKELSLNRTLISNNNLQIFKNDMVRFHNNDTTNLTLRKNDSTLIFAIYPLHHHNPF